MNESIDCNGWSEWMREGGRGRESEWCHSGTLMENGMNLASSCLYHPFPLFERGNSLDEGKRKRQWIDFREWFLHLLIILNWIEDHTEHWRDTLQVVIPHWMVCIYYLILHWNTVSSLKEMHRCLCGCNPLFYSCPSQIGCISRPQFRPIMPITRFLPSPPPSPLLLSFPSFLPLFSSSSHSLVSVLECIMSIGLVSLSFHFSLLFIEPSLSFHSDE